MGLMGVVDTELVRRRSLTVRDRIIVTVVVLSALALTVAGATAWALQLERVDREIRDALHRTIEELITLAETGVDPDTGEPFAGSDRLLYTMMSREVPAANEGMVAFLGENLRYQTQDIGVPLALDPEFVHAVSAIWQEGLARDEIIIDSIRTSLREYRFAAVPVQVGDTPPGALILAFDRDAAQAEIDDTFRTYALVAVVSLVLLAAVSWLLSHRLLRPLRMLRDTASTISDSDLSRRIPVSGEDDLSDLARTFNAMLDRLETSFTSQRQLLDDAGHELRTPITIVRGHLELMDPDDPQDAAATRELTMSELDRMHRLADDLVLLAKADAPDFVQPSPTAVGELLDTVLDHARPLGERRWRLTERAEAVAELDAQRVTQALLQLAANAVKFSAEGSTINFGSAVHDENVLLWVTDEGVGIAADQQTHIFDRFAQVGESRSRSGSGLGLSIVSAIAAGHGGRVEVDSRLGEGSRFTLVLPSPGVEVDLGEDEEIIVEPDTAEIRAIPHPPNGAQ